MEFVFEAILELILEVSIEASKNRKIPKPIRYFLFILISLFFISVIGLMLFVGLSVLKENVLGGIVFLGVVTFMIIAGMVKFKRIYMMKKTN